MNQTYKNKERKINNIIFGQYLKNGAQYNMGATNYATPTDFIFTAFRRIEIRTMTLFMQDANKMEYQKFGSIPALTNGMRVWYKKTSTDDKIYLDAGIPIKTTGNFASLSNRIDIKEKGTGDNAVQGSWDFKEQFGDNLLLEKGGVIGITLNDDLSTGDLSIMTIFVKGFYYN